MGVAKKVARAATKPTRKRSFLAHRVIGLDTKAGCVRIEIYLPSVANLREHWAVKAKRVRLHRGLGNLAAIAFPHIRKDFMHEEWPTWIAVQLTRVAPRELDDDNLRSAFKGFRDGIADALGTSDRDHHIRWDYAQKKGEPGYFGVEIGLAFRERDL